MPITRRLPIGLRVLDATHDHDIYYDNTKFSLGSGRLTLIDPLGGDISGVFHKVDVGFSRSRWDHADFLLPNQFNIPNTAGIQVRYLYSDTEYDIHNGTDRNTLDSSMAPTWLTQSAMRSQALSYGRFRYFQFLFQTNFSAQQSYIGECAFTEYCDIATFTATRLEVAIDGDTFPRVSATVGDSLDLQFHFFTGSQQSYDLTGAQIVFAAKRYLTATTYAIQPVTLEVDSDPTTGIAELHLLGAATQALPLGQYLGEVRILDGGTTKHFRFPLNLGASVITT
ncbi:MAG: hypothetical protein E6R03_01625 [Hyphomicrobiaceae bacterium]|nr:MAG: hypothetical protein E6R03_01625 [Hyphomicrobiaceae bacterium]